MTEEKQAEKSGQTFWKQIPASEVTSFKDGASCLSEMEVCFMDL